MDDGDPEARLPDAEFLIKVLVVYNVDPVWVLLGEPLGRRPGGPFGDSSAAEIAPYRVNQALAGFVIPDFEKENHPRVNWQGADLAPVCVSALAFDPNWLKRMLGLTVNECLVVENSDDGMSPTLEARDVTVCDIRFQTVSADGLYAFVHRGKVRIRRFQQMLTGALKIISDNPAYKVEEVPAKEAETFGVIGRVVWPRLK